MIMKDRNNREPSQKKDFRSLSPEARNRVFLLVVNTAILTFIYFGSMGIGQPLLALIVNVGYWVILLALVAIYLIYNRGFTQKNILPEMLPDSWSHEEKAKYIADSNERYKNSKWMLTVIIPIMIPIALDAISLFTWPIIQSLFGFSQ